MTTVYRRFAITSALAMLLALAPANAIAAEGGGKSRANARHVATGEESSKKVTARGKSRRASRANAASEKTEFTQTRTKRSRRGKSDKAAPVAVASADTELPTLIQTAADATALSAHVEAADFSGPSGALALYQLMGKAASDAALTDPETAALSSVIKDTGYSALLSETEARLVTASEGQIEGTADDILAVLADALGIDRPSPNKLSNRPELG